MTARQKGPISITLAGIERALCRAPTRSRRSAKGRGELALVAEGLSNQEIAERLVVSPWTAETHVSRAMVKLGTRDRAQLVAFAYESGLARPGWLD